MLRRLLPLAVLTLGGVAVPAQGQIEGGVQGTMNSGLVSGEATLGLGGRVGGYLIHTGTVDWKVDGTFDYFFANCVLEGLSCWAWHAGVNFLGTRKLGQPLLGYAGVGAAYQRWRFTTTDTPLTSDYIGVNLIVGAQLPAVRVVRPFFEARFTVFDGVENQLVLSLGLLFSTAKVRDDF